MEASDKLKLKVHKFCISERKKRQKLTYNYGTVCVGVEDENRRYRKCSVSFKNAPDYYFRADIDKRLARVEKIELVEKYCILGYCAEPHAANNLLKCLNTGSKNTIITESSHFIFSKALRVRTHQHVDYCKFCKHTFPQL